jgi:branched-chain amino acid transport system ATP-binding protein
VPEGRKLFPPLTVLENLELGAYTRRAKPRRARTLSGAELRASGAIRKALSRPMIGPRRAVLP